MQTTKRTKRIKRNKGNRNSKVVLRIKLPRFKKFPRFDGERLSGIQIVNYCKKLLEKALQNPYSLLEYMSFLTIAIFILLLPQLQSDSYTFSDEFPRFIAFLILATALTSIFFIRLSFWGRKNIIQSPILNILIIFLLGYIFASMLSASPIVSIMGLYGKWVLSLISIIAFIAITLAITNNKLVAQKPNLIGGLLIISIILSIYFNIIQPMIIREADLSAFDVIFRLNPSIKEPAVSPNPIQLASFFAILIPLVLAIALDSKSLMKKVVSILIIVLTLFAIIRLRAYIILIFAILSFVAALVIYRKPKIQWQKFIPPVGVTFVILAIFTTYTIQPYQWARIKTVIKSNFEKASTQYQITHDVLIKKPLNGTGPEILHSQYGNYSANAYSDKEQSYKIAQNYSQKIEQKNYLNNTFLQIVATTGILGSSLLIALIAIILKSIITNLQNMNFLQKGFCISMLLWLILKLFSLPSFADLLVGAILLSMVILSTKNHVERSVETTRTSRFLLITTIITTILSLYLINNINQAELLATNLKKDISAIEIAKSSQMIDKNPNEAHYHVIHANQLLRFLLEEPSRANRSEILRQIQISTQTAIAIDPWRLDSYYKVAQIFTILEQQYPNIGYCSLAEGYLIKAELLDPKNIYTKILLADAFYISQKNDKALAKIEAIIKIDPENIEAQLFKANILISQNELDRAEKVAKNILSQNIDEKYTDAARNILLIIEINRAFQNTENIE